MSIAELKLLINELLGDAFWFLASYVAVMTAKDYVTTLLKSFKIKKSNTINIGDLIEVGGKKGKLEYIGWTKIRLSDENSNVIIPIDKFYTSIIVVHSSNSKIEQMQAELDALKKASKEKEESE